MCVCVCIYWRRGWVGVVFCTFLGTPIVLLVKLDMNLCIFTISTADAILSYWKYHSNIHMQHQSTYAAHEYMVNLFLPTKKILAKHQQSRKPEREREFISTWISFSRSYPLFVFIVGAVVVLVWYFSIVKQECSALKYYSTHHLYTHRFVNTDIFFSDKMKLSLYNSVMFYCSFVRSSSNKWE